MNAGRITRITLSGELRGSAALYENGGSTRIRLSLRGLKAGMHLLVCGKEGMAIALLNGSETTIERMGICAIAVEQGGRTISSGFSGECIKDRSRILQELRISAAQLDEAAESKLHAGTDTAKPAAEGKAPREAGPEQSAPGSGMNSRPHGRRTFPFMPSASATRDILEVASRLFGMQAIPDAPEPVQADRFEPIPNPFPRTFPGSVWKRKQDDPILYGEFMRNGMKTSLAAIPAGPGGRIGLPSPAIYLTARDGRRYFVEAHTEKA